jgi:sugar-specific transcriptional regulator TrmB
MREGLFNKLGLNASETRILLHLYEHGKARAATIARKTDLKRTTVYSILDELKSKGLVSIEQGKGAVFFVASHPSALVGVIGEQKRKLQEAESAAVELVEFLEPYFRTKNESIPKLKFYEGAKGVRTMLFENSAAWVRSMQATDGAFWGYQDHSFVEQHMDWLKFYWTRYHSKDARLTVKLFSNEAAIEKQLKGKVSRREIRPIAAEFQCETTLWICGDYIILISDRENPPYAVQLFDKAFAKNLRMMFKLLWSR